MSTSKQSLQLSQDLMNLQSQYNALNIEKNRIASELVIVREENHNLKEHNKFLKSRLQDKQKQIKTAVAKSESIQKECSKECFLN